VTETAREGEFVRSLERGLAVIRAFGEDSPRMSLSDVARASGLTRAAARRFLHTLVHLGYMHTDGRTFALKARILELGYSYLSSFSLPDIAMPHLEQLVEAVHESSSVSVLDGDDIVYVARVPTKRIMRLTISVGTRFPAVATSMGRVLLAGRPDQWLTDFLARVDLPTFTGRSIFDAGQLHAELERIRAQGWALVDQELEEGLRAVAAPIHDGDRRVVAAINVSAHTSNRTLDEMRRLLPRLLETADAIGEDLRRIGGSSRRR
jgi:IclR family pca regulon transcriptional regulator